MNALYCFYKVARSTLNYNFYIFSIAIFQLTSIFDPVYFSSEMI